MRRCPELAMRQVGERRPCVALDEVARQMGECKRCGKAGALDGVLRAARYAPLPVRDLIAWVVTRWSGNAVRVAAK